MRRALTASSDDGLPQRIAAVRAQLGLAQRAFAVRVGVSRNIVIRWERGHHRPRAAALERIAAVGGVTVDWLLRGDRGQPPAAREPRFEEAVEPLRAAWRDPRQRPAMLHTLQRVVARDHSSGRPTGVRRFLWHLPCYILVRTIDQQAHDRE